MLQSTESVLRLCKEDTELLLLLPIRNKLPHGLCVLFICRIESTAWPLEGYLRKVAYEASHVCLLRSCFLPERWYIMEKKPTFSPNQSLCIRQSIFTC